MNHVAIVEDIREVVVRADLLKLLKRGELRLVIPQAKISHRGCVLVDGRRGEVLHRREISFVEHLEPVRLARKLDVARDVWRFLLKFTGRDKISLHEGRSDQTSQDRD